jgi:acetyltransferase
MQPRQILPEIDIRPVQRDDNPRLLAFLQGLSAESRYRRYHMHAEIDPSEVALVCSLKPHQGAAFVVIHCANPDVIIGLAYYVRSRRDSTVAEPAIAIADEWQGQGIGRALASFMGEHARRNGVEVFEALVLPGNGPAGGLMTRSGLHYETVYAYGEREVRLYLNTPQEEDGTDKEEGVQIAPHRLSPFVPDPRE